VCLLFLVLLAPLTARAEPLRTIVADVGLDQKLDVQIPLDVTVVNERGERVPLRSAFGKRPVVLNFVQYRCRMLCTQVLNGLLRSSQAIPFRLGQDYDIVTISIDPSETPKLAAEKKRTYVGSYRRPGGEEGWHFYTADEATIARLTKAAGFRFRYDPASDQYAHPSGIILLTPAGRVSRYLYGIEYDPRDLRLGLVEASQHKIGGLVEQVLLLCFHYDPATGKYGFVIEGGIRVAGVATVLVLGGFLIRMFRLERQRSRAERDAQPSTLAVSP
jgi:protein SCO1/2